MDLRRAVFAHVQRMPVAFFTRTRTGALVSRLNNDVIGAQSAITSTLSSVLSNVIQLVLAAGGDDRPRLAGDALALLLLPIFVLPARRMGARIAELRREAADLNAAMSNQMTERFSAPGATLVKLFGRPEAEVARVRRAGRAGARHRGAHGDGVAGVRDGAVAGVRAGPGAGLRARRLPGGDRGDPPGTVVTLALLLTRLYTPMTPLANARVDVMTALVSFERVFEVLDLGPSITERPDAAAAAGRPARRAPARRALRLPERGARCRWRRWRRSPCSTAG